MGLLQTLFPNIDFKFRYGKKQALNNTSIQNGTFNFTIDTREFFVDIKNHRFKISDLVFDLEENIRFLTNPETKPYIAIDTFKILWFDRVSMNWVVIGSDDVAHSVRADYATHDDAGNNICQYYMPVKEAENNHNYLQTQLNDLFYVIGDIERFDIELVNDVSELPPTGIKGILYFVMEDEVAFMDEVTNKTKTSKIYGEYLWIEQTVIVQPDKDVPGYSTYEKFGYYEKIGITTVDLTNYYTKGETDDIVQNLNTELSNKITELENTTNTNMENLETNMDNKITQLKEDTEANFESMDSNMESLETDLNNKITQLKEDTETNFASMGDNNQEEFNTIYNTIKRLKEYTDYKIYRETHYVDCGDEDNEDGEEPTLPTEQSPSFITDPWPWELKNEDGEEGDGV